MLEMERELIFATTISTIYRYSILFGKTRDQKKKVDIKEFYNFLVRENKQRSYHHTNIEAKNINSLTINAMIANDGNNNNRTSTPTRGKN